MASSLPKMRKNSASFSQSIRNRLRLKKHQAQAKNFCRVLDIRVPQIVHPDGRQPRLPTAPLHFVIQKMLGFWEQPPLRSGRHVPLQRFYQKIRQRHHPAAFGRLGRKNQILPALAGVVFRDGQRSGRKIKIRCRQRQQLSRPDPRPEQQQKGRPGGGLVPQTIQKPRKLRRRPDDHPLGLLFADAPGQLAGVVGQAVVLHREVEHAAGLVVQGFLIGGREALSDQLVLPAADQRGRDL